MGSLPQQPGTWFFIGLLVAGAMLAGCTTTLPPHPGTTGLTVVIANKGPAPALGRLSTSGTSDDASSEVTVPPGSTITLPVRAWSLQLNLAVVFRAPSGAEAQSSRHMDLALCKGTTMYRIEVATEPHAVFVDEHRTECD